MIDREVVGRKKLLIVRTMLQAVEKQLKEFKGMD
jgi:hypothetical protein